MMAFNADTYRANQYRKRAAADLEAARDIKRRAAAGKAYDWELPRIATYASLARGAMRLSRQYRAIAQTKKDLCR